MKGRLKENGMKYHGFFLVICILFVFMWIAIKWLDYWKWNAEQADKKSRRKTA